MTFDAYKKGMDKDEFRATKELSRKHLEEKTEELRSTDIYNEPEEKKSHVYTEDDTLPTDIKKHQLIHDSSRVDDMNETATEEMEQERIAERAAYETVIAKEHREDKIAEIEARIRELELKEQELSNLSAREGFEMEEERRKIQERYMQDLKKMSERAGAEEVGRANSSVSVHSDEMDAHKKKRAELDTSREAITEEIVEARKMLKMFRIIGPEQQN